MSKAQLNPEVLMYFRGMPLLQAGKHMGIPDIRLMSFTGEECLMRSKEDVQELINELEKAKDLL